MPLVTTTCWICSLLHHPAVPHASVDPLPSTLHPAATAARHVVSKQRHQHGPAPEQKKHRQLQILAPTTHKHKLRNWRTVVEFYPYEKVMCR